MTLKHFLDFCDKEKIPLDTEIVLSSDEEGNSFHILDFISLSYRVKTKNGEVEEPFIIGYDKKSIEKAIKHYGKDSEGKDRYFKALILFP